ncbi:hypothetical protein ACQ86N_43225 [Puia sp. P3]|uniref:hypothetical protein n=1 Tax=Puia sp. P3 TaxID=3423952 RepID=UPI003D671930
MMAGMLLAIATYPFLFRQLLTISGTEGRTALNDQKEIRSSVSFIAGSRDLIRTSSTLLHYDGGLLITETQKDTVYASGKAAAKPAVITSRTLGDADYWKMVGILFLMVLYVTMVYGPIAAFLVELFPTRIRYTSMSLPYHIGNGIFGGMTPFIATLLTTLTTGNKLVGLWYPIAVTGICLIIGVLYIPSRPRELEA